jgi:hypothetical protein
VYKDKKAATETTIGRIMDQQLQGAQRQQLAIEQHFQRILQYQQEILHFELGRL